MQAFVLESSSENTSWAIEQVANLHQCIARMLNSEIDEMRVTRSMREWTAFHVIDDALRKSTDPDAAYELILHEFRELGVRQADLYLLPEPVEFMGSRTFVRPPVYWALVCHPTPFWGVWAATSSWRSC